MTDREARVPDLDALTFDAVITSSNDAIVTTTLDGIVLSWNPAAERLFGYTEADMIGRPITILFPADRLDEEQRFLATIRSGGRVDHFETVRIRKDGDSVDISVTLSPIQDGSGRIVGISKIARNLTEQRRAQAQLHAQEKLLRTALASITDAVITTDRDARVTYMNTVAERLTGWTADEARGRRVDEVFQVVDAKTGARVLDAAAVFQGTASRVLPSNAVLIARDGTPRPIGDGAAPITDDDGDVLGAVFVFYEASEQRRVEHDLQRLAAIVQSSDDAIVSKTLRGIVTSWNIGAERMFGYTSEEIVGRPITTLFPPDRLDEEAEFQARLLRGEHVEHFETVRVRKDGQQIHVSVSLSPIRNRDGEIVGVSKIARDITERVKLTTRERAARQEAEAANRVKDEFIATLSHELRTPLHAVFGWVRLLQSGRLEPAMHQHALEVIGRNCQAQLDLINDLLDMSRIVTGRVVLNLATLNLKDVVEAAVDAVMPMAAEKDITLEAECVPGTPAIIGDAERLRQVVSNLLTNAVKFTDRGGLVRVRLYQAGSKVNVTVVDNGIGIDGDALPHVFERFRQADSSIGRKHGGLGLGLAIVRHFVELHGGRVRAWSEGRGRGASFTVALPVAAVRLSEPVSKKSAAAATSLPEQRLKGVRILVVDDDPDSRELIGEALHGAGAVVFAAATVREGLGTMAAERPDVIVSDLGMPGEDGFALIRRVRALPEPALAGTPALALTAYTRSADQQVARAAGFNAHLAKPVEPFSLVEAVFDLVFVIGDAAER